MASRVIHTGQAVVDVVMRIGALPAPGGDVFADDWSMRPGGGFNVMAAASRDRATVEYTGGHGTGPFGDLVRAAMATEGIAVGAPRSAERDTGFSIALVDDAAERTFISTLGAEETTDAGVLRNLAVQSPDVVYLSGYSLFHPHSRDVLRRWLPSIPAGVQVVLDASPMIGELPTELIDAIAPYVTLWSLNETEARTLLGRIAGGVDADAAADDIAAGLNAALGAAVVVRIGPGGCWLATGDEPTLVPGIEVEAIDTNGAGDAHCGVVCAALSRGESLLSAVRRANVAAAIATTRNGPATAPAYDEIARVLGSRA